MNLKNIYKISLFILIFFISVFLFSKNAHADWLSDPLGATKPDTGITDINSGIKTAVNGIITISEIAFIVLFLVGGVMYLTSLGNEEHAQKARRLLLDAVIGLIIVLFAWAGSSWIIGVLSGSSSNTTNTNISASANPTSSATKTTQTNTTK